LISTKTGRRFQAEVLDEGGERGWFVEWYCPKEVVFEWDLALMAGPVEDGAEI